MNRIDFAELAMETMDLTRGMKSPTRGQDSKIEGPGLLYFLDRGEKTFCIRGLCWEDLKELSEKISEGKFKLENLCLYDSEKHDLLFYPTKTMDLANLVFQHAFNHRFPMKADLIFNISDPGFTWWMEMEDDGFQIFMRYPEKEKNEKMSNLGPLGDPKKAKIAINEIVLRLANLIPIEEFYCSEISFFLRVKDKKNFFFQALKNLFFQGGMEKEIIEYFGPYLGPTQLNFFTEISTIRGFWKKIQEELG
jgi:hypothetical protein